MASTEVPATKEAVTATVTRSCLQEFQNCIKELGGRNKIHFQTRLADLRLWADSVGATAHANASLDWRFQHRPGDIYFIQGLLSMLEGFLKECSTAAKNKSDVRDIITNIDSSVESLAFIGVQIRRSGRRSRLRKADRSFDENRDKYHKLRAHLACVIVSRPTEMGRPKNEGKDIHSVDYFADLELRPIQERLVEANLKRRHRFIEAQRHSKGLKDPFTMISYNVFPQHFLTLAATDSKQGISPTQEREIATAVQNKQKSTAGATRDALTIPTTSASGLDSKWGGLTSRRRQGSTYSRITAITAAAKYPRAHRPSNPDQKLIQCPCCCQAIPAGELEDSQWRKHVANDLCPYTCVIENCPSPYNLFVTQKEWNDHVMNDHPPQWQCPCCSGDPPRFKSLSGITGHLMSEHLHSTSEDLEYLLSESEIHVMGISQCPLCDSEGPEDSPDLVEHVLQHVHDFSLRSLPWPIDPNFSLDKAVGTFDMRHAFNIVEDDTGNEHTFSVAAWAESVGPTVDLDRGLVVDDSEGNILVLDIDGWPDNMTMRHEPSLQLCDIDKNPPKASEEDLITRDNPDKDFYSQNSYFMDESSDGRLGSEDSHSSQHNATKAREKHQSRKWICTLCNLSSVEGDYAYSKHLKDMHYQDRDGQKVGDFEARREWERSMLMEAYWNGMETISANHSRDSIGSHPRSAFSATEIDWRSEFESESDNDTENPDHNDEDSDSDRGPIMASRARLSARPLLDSPVHTSNVSDVNVEAREGELHDSSIDVYEEQVQQPLNSSLNPNAQDERHANKFMLGSFRNLEDAMELPPDRGAELSPKDGDDQRLLSTTGEAEHMLSSAVVSGSPLRTERIRSGSFHSTGSEEESQEPNREQLSQGNGSPEIDKPLPSCPRSFGPPSIYSDWYTLEGYTSAAICPSCYKGVFAETPFEDCFKTRQLTEQPVKQYCDFSSPWLRLAWLLTIKQCRLTLDLLYLIIEIDDTERPCPEDRELGTDLVKWYGISDQDRVHVPKFALCPGDKKKIEALFPSVVGEFTALPSTNRQDVKGKKHICSLRTSSRRFPEYLDLLVELDAEAQSLNERPNMVRFVQMARDNAFSLECSRDKTFSGQFWHFIPSLPEFTVCVECWKKVVWPLLQSKSNSITIPRMMNKGPEPVPDEDPDIGSSCCLYSPRMRGVWETAVRDEDFSYLKRKAVDRKGVETRICRERKSILSWIKGLERGSTEWESAKSELRELELEWAVWE